MGRRTRSNLKRLDRGEKLNEYFDLEIRESQRTDYHLHLDTSEGPFSVTRTERDEGFLIFLFSAQQHLKANGFHRFVAIHQSKDAYPYFKYRGQKMILEDRVQGEPFTYTPENIRLGMETLAEFHKAARGLNPMPGSEFKVTWGKWPDRCFAEVNDLVKQKLLLKEKRSSSFDERFWEQVDHLIERGLMAWQRFNHEDYRKVLKEEMEARAFNLHSYKAEHLQVVDGEVVIKNMERIRFEVQVYDLALFLDEILRETNMSPKEVAGFVKHYTRVRPLSREEHEALIAFLLYPKGLYRLIRHYYMNRRVRSGMQRFEEYVKLMEREEELVRHLEEESGE